MIVSFCIIGDVRNKYPSPLFKHLITSNKISKYYTFLYKSLILLLLLLVCGSSGSLPSSFAASSPELRSLELTSHVSHRIHVTGKQPGPKLESQQSHRWHVMWHGELLPKFDLRKITHTLCSIMRRYQNLFSSNVKIPKIQRGLLGWWWEKV